MGINGKYCLSRMKHGLLKTSQAQNGHNFGLFGFYLTPNDRMLTMQRPKETKKKNCCVCVEGNFVSARK